MKDVNICLGRFQPFTKGHLRLPEAGHKENNLPCVIFMIHNKKIDSHHPFSDELIQKEMDVIKKQYKDIIIDTFYVASADIKEIARICHENDYEPRLWLTGTDRYAMYKRMATSPKYQKEYGLRSDFDAYEVHRTDEDISATKVREALKNDDKKSYDEMMPVNDDKLYNEFKDALSSVKENRMMSLKDYILEHKEPKFNSFKGNNLYDKLLKQMKDELNSSKDNKSSVYNISSNNSLVIGVVYLTLSKTNVIEYHLDTDIVCDEDTGLDYSYNKETHNNEKEFKKEFDKLDVTEAVEDFRHYYQFNDYE